jgi:hypothetical protein
MPALHEEVAGTVVGIQAWGYDIELTGGTSAYLDNIKANRCDGGECLSIGVQVLAVVLDDQRSPIRLSRLQRTLISRGVCVEPKRRGDCSGDLPTGYGARVVEVGQQARPVARRCISRVGC